MAKVANTVEQLAPFSFMGLLANEGQVPGASGEITVSPASAKIDELKSDLSVGFKEDINLFSLMVETGAMAANAPAKRRSFNFKAPRIVRPMSLGGGINGALAH